MNKIILIGGAPGTGKTTVAKELATNLDIPWISTDQIRNIMNTTSANNEVDESEWKEAGYDDSDYIWKGVESFINSHHPWEDCIIEGMAVLPHLIPKNNDNIKTIFLIEDDEKKILETLKERSKLPYIKTKTESQVNAKHSEILLFNKKIVEEAGKHNLKTLNMSEYSLEKMKEVLDLD